MNTRQYEFSWDFIGDIEDGRPNLGNTTRIEVYRLFQYTLRDILEQRGGTLEANKILFDAGVLAGKHLAERFIGRYNSVTEFLSASKKVLIELGIGILRVEKSDVDTGHFILSVEEDLDCSGLPDTGHEVCSYDEGFLKGLFEFQTGAIFDVKEIDCWCLGDRTCRFEVKVANG